MSVAVTRCRRIGVDIERVRTISGMTDLAQRYFSPLEWEALRDLPEELRIASFFHCWTRKEAYLKGTGHGLSVDMRDFEVTVLPSENPRIISIRNSDEDAAEWSLYSFTPEAGCVGTIAIDSPERYRIVTSHLDSFVSAI